jgi:hypothetical protein
MIPVGNKLGSDPPFGIIDPGYNTSLQSPVYQP